MTNIHVRVLLRPEPDLEKLGRALLAIAQSLPPEEQDKLAAEGAEIAKKLGIVTRPKHGRKKGSAA